MKRSLFFLLLFVVSSCANQTRQRGTNLSSIEGETEIEEIENAPPKSKSSDRAPKGEIELGITGESTQRVVIEESDDNETPPTESDSETVELKPITSKKVDCKKTPKHKSCIKDPVDDGDDLILNEPKVDDADDAEDTPE